MVNRSERGTPTKWLALSSLYSILRALSAKMTLQNASVCNKVDLSAR